MSAPEKGDGAGKLAAVVKPSEVASIRQALMGDAELARYIGFSKSWVRQMRATDRKRMRAGLEPLGPPFLLLLGRNVRYPVAAVDEWISRSSVERGEVKRHKVAP